MTDPIPAGVGAPTLPAIPVPDLQLSPETLILRAIEHGVSVDGLERLLAMRAELRREAAEAAFFEAMSAFQGRCPVIPKTKTAGRPGTNFGYKYAPLDAIVDQVAPLLMEHGLSYDFDARFETEPHPAQVVTCTVHHLQGHSRSSEFRTPLDMSSNMNVMQKSASALTYAKRYAFCNALGILTGDEDNDAQTVDQDGVIHRSRQAARGGVSERRSETSQAPGPNTTGAAAPRGGEPPPPTAPRPAGVGPQPRRQNVIEVPPQSTRQLAEDAAQAHLSEPEKAQAGVGFDEPHPADTMEQARRGELGLAAQKTAENFGRLPEGVDPNLELVERQKATRELLLDRQQARQMAAMLWQLRVEERNRKSKVENQRRALMSQPLVALTPDPGSEPTDESDQRLSTWIESAFPGRKLETLDETSLERVLASLSKMCEDLAEKLKSTGPPPEPEVVP